MDALKETKIHYAELSQTDFREQQLEDHHHCCLCGTELVLTHVTHFTHLEVTEEAHCPSCHVRNRKVQHRLQ